MSLTSYPANPVLGERYLDERTGDAYIWTGSMWAMVGRLDGVKKSLEPSEEQLDMYPSLKSAWEEYLVVRKLLGL